VASGSRIVPPAGALRPRRASSTPNALPIIARADFHHSVRRLQLLSGGSLREDRRMRSASSPPAGSTRSSRGAGGRQAPGARVVRPGKGNPEPGRDAGMLVLRAKRQKAGQKSSSPAPGCTSATNASTGQDRVIASGEAQPPLRFSAMTPVGRPTTSTALPSSAASAASAVTRSPGLRPLPGVAICTECLALCREIITEELALTSCSRCHNDSARSSAWQVVRPGDCHRVAEVAISA